MSGYRKAVGSRMPCIEGTRPSAKNNLVTLSSGVGSLDALLGGGIPLGSILLIEEDRDNSYAPYLLKYFLAEGACCSHNLCLAGQQNQFGNILQNLPGVSASGDASRQKELSGSVEASDSMKIAWRYDSVPKVQSDLESSTALRCHNFDLSTKLSEELLNQSEVHCMDVSLAESYDSLLDGLTSRLKDGMYSAHDPCDRKNVLRIGIESLGSPLWGSEKDLPRTFCLLKSVLRQRYASAMVTVPSHLLSGSVVRRIRGHCDAVFQLDSFDAATQENEALSQFHGFFRVVGLPKLHSVNVNIPDCLDLAFKLKRHKFSIERLHLPPDMSEVQANPAAGQSCQIAVRNAKLDF